MWTLHVETRSLHLPGLSRGPFSNHTWPGFSFGVGSYAAPAGPSRTALTAAMVMFAADVSADAPLRPGLRLRMWRYLRLFWGRSGGFPWCCLNLSCQTLVWHRLLSCRQPMSCSRLTLTFRCPHRGVLMFRCPWDLHLSLCPCRQCCSFPRSRCRRARFGRTWMETGRISPPCRPLHPSFFSGLTGSELVTNWLGAVWRVISKRRR